MSSCGGCAKSLVIDCWNGCDCGYEKIQEALAEYEGGGE